MKTITAIIYRMRNSPAVNAWIDKMTLILGDIETAEDDNGDVLLKADTLAWATALSDFGAEVAEVVE